MPSGIYKRTITDKIREANRKRMLGKKCNNWKGGITIHEGRAWIWKPEHPNAKKGYVRRSRLIMEEKLGRALLQIEAVHHIDGNKINDNPKNLMLFSTSPEHTKYHHKLKRENPTRKTLIKECDKLFSKLIRQKGKCEMCGKKEGLACAHIFSRRNFNTRWDETNALCLCVYHHLYFAHKEPIRFYDWCIKRLGEDRYKKLRQRADMSVHNQDLAGILLFLQQELKKTTE